VSRSIPWRLRYKGARDILAVTTPDDLHLAVDYNARATVLTHDHPAAVVTAAQQVEQELIDANQSLTTLRDTNTFTIRYTSNRPLPQALSDLIADRRQRMLDIAQAKYGLGEDDFICRINLLTRSIDTKFHHDDETFDGLTYVETFFGPGTRIANSLTERFRMLAPVGCHRLDAGQGVLMNLHGRTYHASPDFDYDRPRLAMGIFLERREP
jgi:hypothetical protein